MKKRLAVGIGLFLIALFFSICPDGQGAPLPAPNKDEANIPPAIKEGLQKKIASISMGNVEIRSLLKTIASISHLNIIATKDVNGRLTIFLEKLENITIGELLEMVLIANAPQLAMDIKGNIINVMTDVDFTKIYGRSYSETRVFQAFKLKYLKPSQAKAAIETVISERATRIYDDASFNAIIIDYPERLERVGIILKSIDVPLVTKEFEFKYASVRTVEKLLNSTNALTAGVSQMRVDDRTHKIFITDTAQNMSEVIGPLLSNLDTRQRQVLIETKMIQIQLNDLYYLGVDWDKVFSSKSQWAGLHLIGKYPFPSAITPKPGSTFSATFATVPTNNFTSTLSALQGFGDVKTISSPRLVALNDTQAKFMVGSRQAYVTTTITTTQAGTTAAENVQFIDVGITLAVSPTINADNFITMHLKPEISSVVERITTGQGNIIPIQQTTNVEVDVMVKDGVSIVIAGLISDDKRHSDSGIPILRSLPLIGPIFRQTGDTQVRSETVIFLTPYIVSGEGDTSVISKQEEMVRKQPKDIREIK